MLPSSFVEQMESQLNKPGNISACFKRIHYCATVDYFPHIGMRMERQTKASWAFHLMLKHIEKRSKGPLTLSSPPLN